MVDIVDYVLNYRIDSTLAKETAWHCFLDTIGCGLEALEYEACRKLLGPITPGTKVINGARVPGTDFELDPVQGAFNIGAAIRWLDFNDTWLAAEWGHPSDNLGGILAVADWLSRSAVANGGKPLLMSDVFEAMIMAHEIQGCIALENSFNKVGLDHVILVKVASTAVVGKMLGLTRDQLLNAISLAWVDGQSLRTYRHFPNAGSRKSWAAGDATSRAVRLALIAKTGEMGYPSALSAKTWGFCDVSFNGNKFKFQRPYGTYVMENVLFPADRDHTIQYMVAIPLIFGRLTARDYEDDIAADPRIDALRERIVCVEDSQFTKDYHDPQKRSIANAVRVIFKDGSASDEVAIEYPIGHKRRRAEGIPLLIKKYRTNLDRIFSPSESAIIANATLNYEELSKMPVNELMELFVKRD
ncbi:MAG: 2-methylcitrate dehydratase [Actinobacteria bacterium]|nr:2-methylcitrate dehydratase [Actinomycetota bacterium]